MIKSGKHLNVIRTWIQNHAERGEYLTWGSDELVELNRPHTVRDYEMLAQKVANATTREILSHLKVCANFESEVYLGGGQIHMCGHCGYSRTLHDIQDYHSVSKESP